MSDNALGITQTTGNAEAESLATGGATAESSSSSGSFTELGGANGGVSDANAEAVGNMMNSAASYTTNYEMLFGENLTD